MTAAIDAPAALGPTLIGLRLAEERGEAAPPMPRREPTAPPDAGEPRETVAPSGRTGESPGREAADARVSAADTPAEKAGAAGSHPDAPEPAGRRLPDGREGTDTPAGTEPGTSGQGPGKA
jgi:NADH-quinone oxidoreductase subunit E